MRRSRRCFSLSDVLLNITGGCTVGPLPRAMPAPIMYPANVNQHAALHYPTISRESTDPVRHVAEWLTTPRSQCNGNQTTCVWSLQSSAYLQLRNYETSTHRFPIFAESSCQGGGLGPSPGSSLNRRQAMESGARCTGDSAARYEGVRGRRVVDGPAALCSIGRGIPKLRWLDYHVPH